MAPNWNVQAQFSIKMQFTIVLFSLKIASKLSFYIAVEMKWFLFTLEMFSYWIIDFHLKLMQYDYELSTPSFYKIYKNSKFIAMLNFSPFESNSHSKQHSKIHPAELFIVFSRCCVFFIGWHFDLKEYK